MKIPSRASAGSPPLALSRLLDSFFDDRCNRLGKADYATLNGTAVTDVLRSLPGSQALDRRVAGIEEPSAVHANVLRDSCECAPACLPACLPVCPCPSASLCVGPCLSLSSSLSLSLCSDGLVPEMHGNGFKAPGPPFRWLLMEPEVSDILAALAYLQSRSLACIRPLLFIFVTFGADRQFSSSLSPLRPETRPAFRQSNAPAERDRERRLGATGARAA